MKYLVKFFEYGTLIDVTYFKTKPEARKFVRAEKRNYTPIQRSSMGLKWQISKEVNK